MNSDLVESERAAIVEVRTARSGRPGTSQARASRLRTPGPAAQLATLLVVTSRGLSCSCVLAIVMMWDAVAPI